MGGLLVALALALLSSLATPIPLLLRQALAVTLLCLLVVRDVLAPNLSLPQRTTLIPQRVFDRGPSRGLLRFGVEYGSGLRTLVPAAAPYILASSLLLVPLPIGETLLVGLAFGAGRAIVPLLHLLVQGDNWQARVDGVNRPLVLLGTASTALLCLLAVLTA